VNLLELLRASGHGATGLYLCRLTVTLPAVATLSREMPFADAVETDVAEAAKNTLV
jgi:hypothetical protein